MTLGLSGCTGNEPGEAEQPAVGTYHETVRVEPSVQSNAGIDGEVFITLSQGNSEEGSFTFSVVGEDDSPGGGKLAIGDSNETGGYRFTLEDIEWDPEVPRWIILVEEIEEQ